jgi:6,7-dimethyl-8-ribityllumazine synthase
MRTTRARVAVAVSRFNEEITGRMLASCLKALREGGVPDARIRTVWVPGAFELPWAARELAASGRFDVVVCLGCVLKGRTPQNDYIAAATCANIQKVSLDTRVPVILGVITPDTHGQALARTRGRMDRGREYGLAALEMAELKVRLKGAAF